MKKATTIWKPDTIGDVIAQRKLTLQRGGKERPVLLQVGRPVRSPKSSRRDPWWCPIELEGLGKDQHFAIAGQDALQALVLALQFVEAVLPHDARELGGRLYWLRRDFGIVFGPKPPGRAEAGTKLKMPARRPSAEPGRFDLRGAAHLES